VRRRTGPVLFSALVMCLALPALALTLARPWDTTVGLVIRLQAFAPLAIPLYGLVLVLCLAGGLRRSGGRRAPLLAAVAVAVAGLGLHLWWFAPQVTGDVPAAADGAHTLTVMSSNLYAGKGDAREVAAAAVRAHVDLLVVEEVDAAALEAMDRAGLAQLLPHRIGSPELDHVSGTMLFSNDDLGEPVRLTTGFQGWRVQVGALTVLAVHPVAPTDPGQWRQDHRVILDEAEESHADMVVGDLNASSDHAVLRDLDDAGLRDAAELANEGWQPTWPANHLGVIPLLPPIVRIDHVLLGPELTAMDTRTVEIDGTDHLALIAEVARR
jgi:endonuclease/exonuclease/phosphatase (EEP) superfamily protein YafD